MSDAVEVTESMCDDVMTLVVRGDLDTPTVARFESSLAGALSSGALAVEIDLSGVGFIGSEAINALVRAWDVASERSVGIRITKESNRVRRVLELMALDEYFS